jgi:hypothetical protein
MAAKIPGIKNIWLKTERNQIKDFSGVYAIEFTSPGRRGGLRGEPGARRVVQAVAGRAREQPVLPDLQSVSAVIATSTLRTSWVARLRRVVNSSLASRVMPEFLRSIRSIALSGSSRLLHFTIVASGVTP